MVWHDCKTDTPKSTGQYILVYRYKKYDYIEWDSAYYVLHDKWYDSREFGSVYWDTMYDLIKWAEVDLSEVE